MNGQNNLEKEQSRDIRLPDFKIYCRATVIQTGWCWHKKDRHIDQQKQKREPRNKPTAIQ